MGEDVRPTGQSLNPRSSTKSLIKRYRAGVYETPNRPSEPPITDHRGPNVRELGTTVTLLTDEQVGGLVADYQAGMKVKAIAEKYDVNRWTVRQHLIRREIPVRRRGIDETLIPKVIALYRAGNTLIEIGHQLGVNPGTLRNTLRNEGVELRVAAPRSRSARPHAAD